MDRICAFGGGVAGGVAAAMSAPIDPFLRKQPWCYRGHDIKTRRPFCHCGCGRVVEPPRRTAFSDQCVTDYQQRNDPGTIRKIVEERDHGVCALCGTDTAEHDRMVRGTVRLWRWLAQREAERLFTAKQLIDYDGKIANAWGAVSWWTHQQVTEQLKDRRWETSVSHLWEADHIIPVIEGGGGCGPEGYRTLCLPCHKKETAALAARLAEKRRAAKRAKDSENSSTLLLTT